MADRALTPVITFLSDYGQLDEFVGVCHGVMARRCPSARVIDLTHAIPRHDVRSGAIVLRSALPFLPAGVHLAVVDPGVSAVGRHARRGVAIRTADHDHLLVGPDNGLLMPAAERLGGVTEAVDIGESPERLLPVSRTFHGRDIFAPVAAALAAGEPLDAVGDPLPVSELRRIGLPSAHERRRPHRPRAAQRHVRQPDPRCDQRATDRARGTARRHVDDQPRRRRAHSALCRHVRRGHPRRTAVYEDATRMVALAVNRGSAAALFGAGADDELTVRPA